MSVENGNLGCAIVAHLFIFQKHILYLWCRRLWLSSADIFTKVFSQSLLENVEVFSTRGQTNDTHFLCSRVAMHVSCVHIPHTIQVWGVASFILVRVFPQPSNN